MRPIPFPYSLNIGTDVVHLPRILRLVNRPDYLHRFTRRILHEQEQQDFRTRFFPLPPSSGAEKAGINAIIPDMARWLAGRFAAKEAARKAAPAGAASLGWKDVIVRVGEADKGRPEIVYLDPLGGGGSGEGRVGKLSISHDGDYVVATVLAAG
jgi:holo-[acyl-carrier protein] synthase